MLTVPSFHCVNEDREGLTPILGSLRSQNVISRLSMPTAQCRI
jgi:hypothetical protein